MKLYILLSFLFLSFGSSRYVLGESVSSSSHTITGKASQVRTACTVAM